MVVGLLQIEVHLPYAQSLKEKRSVLKSLKADAAVAHIPVVMLTILDDRNTGFALGAADFLTKPLDRERMRAVLERYRVHLTVGRLLIQPVSHRMTQ